MEATRRYILVMNVERTNDTCTITGQLVMITIIIRKEAGNGDKW